MPTTVGPTRSRFWRAIVSAALGASALLGQGKPPASMVPEPYRQKFVRYVDQRSMTEKALNLINLTSQDVGRSFGLVAGVSKYPNMPELQKELPAAAADVDALQEYLRDQEFFDEIVVLRDGDVTEDNLKYFLEVYFPERLKKFSKPRFLFAYSGHGMAQGPKENPTGYLLKSTARNFDDKINAINMTILRVYVDEVRDAGYQTLALINACNSGAFLSRSTFGKGPAHPQEGGIYFPKNGGAHAITSGGSNEPSWHDPKLGKGSVFFEKLLAGLGGQADVYPINPETGQRGDGIITVDEIATYLQEEVKFATHQEQNPIPADLALNRSLGGFFFLSRQKMIAYGIMPEWHPNRATPFGINAEKTLIIAKEYYASGQYDQALPLFRNAAEAENAEAVAYLAFMYDNGLGGLPKDEAQAVNWYRKAADAGSVRAMNNLGVAYENAEGGLPKSDALAVKWYRKAADAGYAVSMNNLGLMYEFGRGGLRKDETQAVSWYLKAAFAGSAEGMADLGIMYEYGRGGLPKDRVKAVNWYRKAADAGDAEGMAGLGFMYDNGLGGLPKDEAQAVNWYRKAADAGSARGVNNLAVAYENGEGGLLNDETLAVKWYRKASDAGYPLSMNNLGEMYEFGRGGLPKNETEAVSWYRKAADAGDADGMTNLGFMYEHGHGGLPKNHAQAVKLYRKAAQLGNTYAKQALKRLGL